MMSTTSMLFAIFEVKDFFVIKMVYSSGTQLFLLGWDEFLSKTF